MSKKFLYSAMMFLGLSFSAVASDKGKEEDVEQSVTALVPVTPAVRVPLTLFDGANKQIDQNAGKPTLIGTLAVGLRQTLFHMLAEMDPISAVQFSRTCKLFYNDYLRVLAHAENNWVNGNRLNAHGLERPAQDRRQVGHLVRLMMHRPTLLRVVKGSLPEDSNKPMTEDPNCERYNALLEMVPQSMAVGEILTKEVLTADLVWDFRFFCLVGALVGRWKPELKAHLEQVIANYRQSYADWHNNNRLEQERMDPALIIPSFDQDEGFIHNLKTRGKEIQAVLMAAKVLSFSGDTTHDVMRANFIQLLRGCIFDDFTEYMKDCPEQPLWVLYGNEVEAGSEYCHVLKEINESGAYRKSLCNARALAVSLNRTRSGYVWDVLPEDQKAAMYENLMIAICSDCIYQDYLGNVDASVAAEKELLELVRVNHDIDELANATDLGLVTTGKIEKILSRDPAVLANYNKVLELLQEILRAEDPWTEFHLLRINDKIVNYILLMGDHTRFDMVDTYLDFLERAGLQDGMNDLPGVVDPYEHNEEISKYRPKLALALYRCDYKTVLESLERVTKFNSVILMAMKYVVSDKNMPEDVAEALGQLIAKTFLYLHEEDALAGEDSFDDKGMVMMIKAIFDDAFCAKYLKNQPEAMAKVQEILAR